MGVDPQESRGSKHSRHSSDQELIAHLYGAGPTNAHVYQCLDCGARLAEMRSHRESVDSLSLTQEPDFEFLAAQRRKIYARLPEAVRWWSKPALKRWGSVAAGIAILAGGLLTIENERRQSATNDISDAQLAAEVSSMAADPETPATAPLEGLFAE